MNPVGTTAPNFAGPSTSATDDYKVPIQTNNKNTCEFYHKKGHLAEKCFVKQSIEQRKNVDII